MKNLVLRIISTMVITAVLLSCNKNEGDIGNGKGVLKINGNEFEITEVSMYVGTTTSWSSFIGRYINFLNKKGEVVVSVEMQPVELISKTYTNTEIVKLGIIINNEEFDRDFGDVVMAVNKSGNTFNITISGKTAENEYEYTLIYNGTIREGRSNSR